MNRFAGSRVLVTGAGRNIGEALARAYAAEGARVAVVDRDGDAARAVAQAIGGVAIVADLAAGQAADAVAQAHAAFGGVDVVVSNAYAGPYLPVVQQDDASWAQALAIGLTALMHLTRAALPGMIAQGGGTILTMGSINGRTPAPSMAVYATIKGGIEAFTRQIAVEYGPQGIRANTLCPGFITDARREAEFVTKPKEKARATSVIPLRRLGTAQDVADAALFLTSPQAAWITGQTLTIDGGQSVQNHRSVTHPFEAMTRDLP